MLSSFVSGKPTKQFEKSQVIQRNCKLLDRLQYYIEKNNTVVSISNFKNRLMFVRSLTPRHKGNTNEFHMFKQCLEI